MRYEMDTTPTQKAKSAMYTYNTILALLPARPKWGKQGPELLGYARKVTNADSVKLVVHNNAVRARVQGNEAVRLGC